MLCSGRKFCRIVPCSHVEDRNLNYASVHLDEGLSEQHVEGAVGFLVEAYNKAGEKRDSVQEELFRKKEASLDNSGNSQSAQFMQNAQNRRFAIKKVCSRKKTKGVTGQILTSALKECKVILCSHRSN